MNNLTSRILKRYGLKEEFQEVKLSAIGDLENAVEEYKAKFSSYKSLMDIFEARADSYYAMKDELDDLDSKIQSVVDDMYTTEGSLVDALQSVEEKAEELGASPSEFIPDYQEIINYEAERDVFDYMVDDYKIYSGQ
jgi:hypothetical protein